MPPGRTTLPGCAQDRKVGDRRATIGEHDRQIDRDPARVMT